MLRDVYAYVFFEGDPATRMHDRDIAKAHTSELLGHIKSHLKDAQAGVRHLSVYYKYEA